MQIILAVESFRNQPNPSKTHLEKLCRHYNSCTEANVILCDCSHNKQMSFLVKVQYVAKTQISCDAFCIIKYQFFYFNYFILITPFTTCSIFNVRYGWTEKILTNQLNCFVKLSRCTLHFLVRDCRNLKQLIMVLFVIFDLENICWRVKAVTLVLCISKCYK